MEKKPILNIMVDLETASTKENAAILSWAMVPFFTDGTEVRDTDAFRLSVSLTSCFLAGMDIDKDTQDWWVNQDPMARWAILGAGEEVSIQSASEKAFAWLECLSEEYDLYVWARGLDFDIPKMEWCFRKFVERPVPYKYSHKMDVRTILKFMQVSQSDREFKGVKHNAMDDCMNDIGLIQEAYRKFRGIEDGSKVQEDGPGLSAQVQADTVNQNIWPYLSKIMKLEYMRKYGITLSREQTEHLESEIGSMVECCDRLLRQVSEYGEQIASLKAENAILSMERENLNKLSEFEGTQIICKD